MRNRYALHKKPTIREFRWYFRREDTAAVHSTHFEEITALKQRPLTYENDSGWIK